MGLKLTAQNLKYNFADGHVLNIPDIDCEFDRLLVIKGHIGCGKTVLLKTLAGIISPDSGRANVKVQENSPSCYYVHSQGEFNFVTYQIKDELEFAGVKDTQGFEQFLTRNVNELSGGELKKISVMMALASEQEFILLDEPLDMLDDEQSAIMAEYIIQASQNKPVIVATHDEHFDVVADAVIKLGETRTPHKMTTNLKNHGNSVLDVQDVQILLPDRKLPLINFTCNEGSVFCIYGTNGKGKTLFLRELAGIGRLSAEGQIDWHIEKFQRGACLQFPEQMVYQESVAKEIEDIAGKELVDEVLKKLRWEDKANKSPFSLSDGEKRTMYLMSVLISKRVCIFDEPFAGLDYATATCISKNFAEASSIGKTVIYTANRRKDILCADTVFELK